MGFLPLLAALPLCSAVRLEHGQPPPASTKYGAVVPLDDFPPGPAMPLLEQASNPVALAGNLTEAPLGLRARRTIISVTGRDLTFADVKGNYVYATEGDVWTLHYHTHLVDAQSQQRLGLLTKTFFSFHRTYEISSYAPVCPSQQPVDQGDGNVPVYPLARITKYLLSIWPYFSVERYSCDGSLAQIYMVQARYAFAWKSYFDVIETASGDKSPPAATVDQTYLFSWTPYYDVWSAKGMDPAMVAVFTLVLDMDKLFSQRKGKDHGDHGHGGHGGTLGKHFHTLGFASSFASANASRNTAGVRPSHGVA